MRPVNILRLHEEFKKGKNSKLKKIERGKVSKPRKEKLVKNFVISNKYLAAMEFS